jgi:mono/diheme cytochrome c family protein
MRIMDRPTAWIFCAFTLARTAAGAEPPIDFSRDIRPILSQHCWSCHGPDDKAREAGLRLDLREKAIEKKAIIPNDLKASKLVARIESADPDKQMPPPESKKPLSDRQKQLLKTWIAEGAAYSQHWAFVAPKRPPVPTVEGVTNPIDAFVRDRLAREKVQPASAADRATLLRRVTLDLTGLPPTPAELDAFLADKSPNAYEKVVDRLLASTRYAERMAMAWLDAARFADTNGFNNDEDRTQWPWRDWLIASFARNQPFDQFVTEQLAGDMLPAATLEQKIATAFLRNQVHNTEGGIIPEEYRVEYVADRVHTTATVFLGLSMQCARCHDHKYDPISQKEYYQFFGFFQNIADKQASYANFVGAEPYIRLPTAEQTKRLTALDARKAELEKQMKEKGPPAPDLAKLKAELAEVVKQHGEIDKTIPAVMVMEEMPRPREGFVLKRGQYDQRGDKVTSGVPAVFPPLGATPQAANRLDLAKWLVSPEHPLTARVAVNRWWQMYFGTGLVKTVEDFGITGEYPSHPELLDWLATELIRTGWDVKAMQRLILTSATYRQSSAVNKESLERDPENRLLARGPRHRLSAEMIRDNALAISGLLAERIGGPSVKPYQPGGLWEDVTVERRGHYVAEKGEGLYRRGMYTFWKRTCPPPGLMTFDAPNREVCVARRATTNTPLQALVMLNDPTYVEAARKLAERMMREGGVTTGFKLAVCREPTAEELRVVGRIHADALAKFKADPEGAKKLLAVGDSPRDATLNVIELAAWTVVASTILNLDETISKR